MLTSEERAELVAKIRNRAAVLTLTASDPATGSRRYRESLLDLADSVEDTAGLIEREKL